MAYICGLSCLLDHSSNARLLLACYALQTRLQRNFFKARNRCLKGKCEAVTFPGNLSSFAWSHQDLVHPLLLAILALSRR